MKSHSINRPGGPTDLLDLTFKFFLLLLAFLIDHRSATAAETAKPCELKAGSYRTVVGVIDGETLELDDGRIIRLVGALAAHADDAGAADDQWPLAVEAQRTLQKLALGKSLRLAIRQKNVDRQGRVLAQAFVGPPSKPVWLQGEMLRRGLARAYGLPNAFDCMMELKAHEQAAREDRRGLWRLQRIYGTKRAGRRGWLLKFRNRFEHVKGQVVDVAERRSATYLNFGEDWRRDFTVRVGKSVRNAHPEWAKTLGRFKNKQIFVRGWIERRNGPMIDIWDPSQIELIEEPGVETPSASGVAASRADGTQRKSAASDVRPPN